MSKDKTEEKKKNKLPRIRIGMGSDKQFLSENLSVLVASGMTVIDALRSIITDVKTGAMKKIITYIIDAVDSGRPLWRSLDEVKVFNEYIISLIRIGEETGRLSQNLKVVSVQEQKSHIFASKIRSAMIYPVFVLSVTVLVAVLIAWFILPRLATVFSQLKMDLPIVTRVLIDLGAFLQVHGKIVVPLFLLSIASIIYFVFVFHKTRFIGQAILFKIPGVQRLLQEVELARFGFLLGTLLDAGVPILEAFDSLKKATQFRPYIKLYTHMQQSIENGYSIHQSFQTFKKTRRLVPYPIQQLISSSEQSGRLPDTFLKIGELYEGKIDDTTKNLTVIMEPILLVIIWLGVVGVALAVILPIYSLIGGFQVR